MVVSAGDLELLLQAFLAVLAALEGLLKLARELTGV
jgi:hypothetical protein